MRVIGQASVPRVPPPCPFCGQPLPDGAARCAQCKMPLDERTRSSLERLMGPWFVFEPGKPSAPGVSWAKFLSLVEKGKVAPTTVIRGPATGGWWKLAQDTPAVALRLGLCWSCHAPQPPDHRLRRCAACQAPLHAPLDWPPSEGEFAPARPEPEEPEEAATQAESPLAPEPDFAAELAAAPDDVPLELSRTIPPSRTPAGGAPPGPGRGSMGKLLRTAVAVLLLAGLSVAVLLGVAHLMGPSDNPSAALPSLNPPAPLPSPRANPATPEPVEAAAPSPGPPRHMPGDLFPDVPYSEPGQPARPAGGTRPAPAPPVTPTSPSDSEHFARVRELAAKQMLLARQAEQTGDLAAAQGLLIAIINNKDPREIPEGAMEALRAVQDTIRARTPGAGSAPALAPEELAKQKDSALAIYKGAKALADNGSDQTAQIMLVQMFRTHVAAAWPEGSQEMLRQVQERLRASASAPGEPSDADLDRQREQAAKLFQQAQNLMTQGNLLAAQEPLMKILNNFHRKAWPDGAEAALKKINDEFGRNPSSAPEFFRVRPKE